MHKAIPMIGQYVRMPMELVEAINVVQEEDGYENYANTVRDLLRMALKIRATKSMVGTPEFVKTLNQLIKGKESEKAIDWLISLPEHQRQSIKDTLNL